METSVSVEPVTVYDQSPRKISCFSDLSSPQKTLVPLTVMVPVPEHLVEEVKWHLDWSLPVKRRPVDVDPYAIVRLYGESEALGKAILRTVARTITENQPRSAMWMKRRSRMETSFSPGRSSTVCE